MKQLRCVLLIGEFDQDVDVAISSLTASGPAPACSRVRSEEELQRALDSASWNLILFDYALRGIHGVEVIAVVRERLPDVPLILVSDPIGEEQTADAMNAGADDIVLRSRLSRLVPAIERILARGSGLGVDLISEVEAVVTVPATNAVGPALKDSDQLFRAVVENTPDLIARFDRGLRRDYVNPAIERLTGMPASALTGKTMSELNFDPRFSAQIEQALAEVFATGSETTMEVFLPAEGGERTFQLKVFPERGATENVEYALVISRDITEISSDKNRLQALSQEVQLLLASTYEGICATDLSGRCTLVNEPAAAMLGFRSDELLNRSLHDFLHGPSDDTSLCRGARCLLLVAAEEQKPGHLMSETFRRKDGSTFPAEVFISPILDDEHAVRSMVISFIDITEREHLQNELERANRLAGLGRVASALSHEFNNILMGIQPFAESLIRKAQDPQTTAAATSIAKSVSRGREITEDLRAFTSPVAPVRTPVDVQSWLAECADELRLLVPTPISFELEVADVPMTIDLDSNQLMKIVRTALRNASEAIGELPGAVRLAINVRADSSKSGDGRNFVSFTVSDNGPGLSKETLQRVFEPLFTTRKGHKGLGLSIAHQIATHHGGQLTVASEPGRGTTVQLLLPESESPVTAQKKPLLPHTSHWPSEILLVEDDEAVAAGISMLLEDGQMSVRVARDGAEALQILSAYRPQALVVDINLPDCDGFDLYENITASFGPLPAVFASGHANSGRLDSLKTSAPVRFLAKPFEIEALVGMLESLNPEID